MSRSDKKLREERFQSILDENRDRIGRIARVYAGGDVEDLVQEVLLQIWRSLPNYDQKAQLGTWAYRVALNTAISWRRSRGRAKRKRPSHRVAVDALPSPPNVCDATKLLERFLDTLGEVDRAVLLMHLEDLTYREIADSIGVSEGAIRTRVSRIRDKLENGELGDDES